MTTNTTMTNTTYSNTHLTLGYVDDGWLWRFVGTVHGDEVDESGFQKLVSASGKLDDTQDLLEVLLAYAPADYDTGDLPTFGGPEPDCTVDVHSWGATHMIVGCPVQGLARVPR